MGSSALSNDKLADLVKNDLIEDLQAFGMENELGYLLLYFENGVVWGSMDENNLLLSRELEPDPQPLSWDLLQQAHFFNLHKELRLWRQDDGLHACWLDDSPIANGETLQEEYLLFGEAMKKQAGFTRLQDGQRGPVQWVPKTIENGKSMALRVSHSLEQDADGQWFISGSRLMDLLEK